MLTKPPHDSSTNNKSTQNRHAGSRKQPWPIGGPVAAVLLSVLTYLMCRYYASPDSVTIVDAEQFLESVHPGLGVSTLSLDRKKQESSTNCGNWEACHDPLLIPALWLNIIASNDNKTEDFGDKSRPNFLQEPVLPFSWNCFLGISSDRAFLAVSEKISNCSGFLREMEKGISDFHIYPNSSCTSTNSSDGLPKMAISGPVDVPLTEETRRYIGANYMFHSMETPQKVVILGVGPLSEPTPVRETHSFSAGVEYSETALANMVEKYMEVHPNATSISLSPEVKILRNMWSTVGLSSSVSVPTALSDKQTMELTPDEFDPHLAREDTLKFQGSPKSDQITLADTPQTKYFHEAELAHTHVGFHYDWRFFKHAEFSDYERKIVLHRLARAWLRFADSAGIRSWLAHGTLLGWYWNGMNLPWDQDIDVQMPFGDFARLVKHNRTLVLDLTDEPEIAGVHSYFLDVNPHYGNRSFDSLNVVDARFIDTDTGMYVDITALAISGYFQKSRKSETALHSERVYRVFDSGYNDRVKSADHASQRGMEKYRSDLSRKAANAWKSRRLYNCKDLHFYELSELSPLIPTSFEGEVAYVPANFRNVLEREYPKYTARVYKDWAFRPFLGVWTRLSKCADLYGNECSDRDMILEEKHTRDFRLKRGHWDRPVWPKPRVDPYVVRENAKLRERDKLMKGSVMERMS